MRGRSKEYVRRLDLARHTVAPWGRRDAIDGSGRGVDRGEGHFGFHLPPEPDARAIGFRSHPHIDGAAIAQRLLDSELINHVLPQPETRHASARVRFRMWDRARTVADPDPRPRWFLYVTDRVARRAGHRARGEDPEGPTNPLSWP